MAHTPCTLNFENVRVCFGSHVAIDALTLGINRGEIVALIGPNGSGKSTTLSVAAGLIAPTSGVATIEGISHADDPTRYSHSVGYVPQDHALYEEFTATQNLEFFGQLYGLRGFALDARICRSLNRTRLSTHADKRVSTLSGGMKQRLGIAIALIHEPTVLLLDEPTASLDAQSRDELFGELHRLRDEGHAILLTTHHAEEAECYCDRVEMLDRGRLLFGGRQAVTATGPTPRTVLYGHLRESVPKFVVRRVRKKLSPNVGFEIIGRRVRLVTSSSDELGRALAMILAEGLPMESFRTTTLATEMMTESPTG